VTIVVDNESSILSRLPSLIAATIVQSWLSFPVCSAQILENGFGPLTSLPLAEQYGHLIELDPAEESIFPQILLWSSESPLGAVIQLDDQRRGNVVGRMQFPKQPIQLFVEKLKKNESKYLIEISSSTLIVMDWNERDSLTVLKQTALPFLPSTWCVADLNNDGNTDIALAEKNNPGIRPMFGNGKGGFRVGKLIAPDNAIGAIAAAYLNNDFLVDLIVFDWVKSELHALYGVGRGRFLDQSTFPVFSDVESIDARPTRNDGPLDLVLRTREPGGLQIWDGNDLGDFRQRENSFSFEPRSPVRIFDANAHKQAGLLSVVGSREAKIFPRLDDPDNFVTVAGTSEIRDGMLLNSSDSTAVLALLGGDGKELTFVSSFAGRVPWQDSLVLAVGGGAAGVSISELRDNGRTSILTVNSGSRSISIFDVERDGGFRAQRQIQMDTAAAEISLIQSSDSTAHAILTDESRGIVTNATVHLYARTIESNIIPTSIGTTVLFTSRRAESVEFGTEVRAAAQHSASFSFFRQLNESQFLEQTFRLPEPYELVGGTFGDINRDGYRDLVIVFHHPDSTMLELATSNGDSAMDMKQIGEPHETSLPFAPQAMLWLADMNGDDTLDIVCLIPERQGTIYVLFGGSKANFSETQQIAVGVDLKGRTDLQIVDCNNDKLPDLVYRDSTTEMLRWWKNEKKLPNAPKLSESRAIGTIRVTGKFFVCDLNGDGFPEIAVTEPRLGRLRIFDGKKIFH
jgi:hypothetical protein